MSTPSFVDAVTTMQSSDEPQASERTLSPVCSRATGVDHVVPPSLVVSNRGPEPVASSIVAHESGAKHVTASTEVPPVGVFTGETESADAS
jgi:hypothetical protein